MVDVEFVTSILTVSEGGASDVYVKELSVVAEVEMGAC